MSQQADNTHDTGAQTDERPTFTREQQEKLLDEVMSLSRTKSIGRTERVEVAIDVETGDIVWQGKLQKGERAMMPDGVQYTVGATADSNFISQDMVAREMHRKARNNSTIRVE